MPRIGAAAPWFALAAAIVVADRLSKLWVLEAFRPGESVAVAPFFNMVLVFNKGAAFSFLASAPGWQTPMFASFAILAAAVISFLLYRHAGKTLFCSGLTLILGGALGNLWDRLQWGQVVDFLDFHVAAWHWPAFNVADSAITIGAAILIAEGFMHREEEGREKRA